MLGYLLDEGDFITLKQYIDFLDSLPEALKEISDFSESYRRLGHKMITPPDSNMLAQTAKSNNMAWQALKLAVPALGQITSSSLVDTQRFIDEFRDIAQVCERNTVINDIDATRFSLAKLPPWDVVPPVDVISLLKDLDFKLEQCSFGIAEFKKAVNSVGVTLHSVFSRFIECLSIDLCSCDGPISKIEAYYVIRKTGLPGMNYDPQGSHSLEDRERYAKAHLVELQKMRIRTSNAVDNLNDFTYRLQQLLVHTQRKLWANHPQSPAGRSSDLLSIAERGVGEAKEMSDKLLLISRKLNA